MLSTLVEAALSSKVTAAAVVLVTGFTVTVPAPLEVKLVTSIDEPSLLFNVTVVPLTVAVRDPVMLAPAPAPT